MAKATRFLLIFALTLLFSVPSFGATRKSSDNGDSIRILFVGNSFTYYNDMPKMVDSIARSCKKKVSVTAVTKGGERFSGHLKNKNLIEMLRDGGWNYVVLQDQSSAPAMPTKDVIEKVYPPARTLDSLVMAGSPNAKVIFYMTWGHKYGTRNPIDGYPLIDSYEGMQERLKTSYLEMAYDNDARCAPVGMAWQRVRRERPDLVLYQPDCYHPSRAGSYLIANVIFATIFPHHYQTGFDAGLPSAEAEYLQQVAQQTVLQNLRLLNIEK